MTTFTQTLQTLHLLRYRYGGNISFTSNKSSITWTVPIRSFTYNTSYAYSNFITTIHHIFPEHLFSYHTDARDDNYTVTLTPINPFADIDPAIKGKEPKIVNIQDHITRHR